MSIDISKIKIPANYVLVKVDLNHDTYHSVETGNDTGLHVAPWGINQATHISVTGTVAAIPKRLRYNGYRVKELKKDKERSKTAQDEVSRLRNASVSYDVDIELIIGYHVMFEYSSRMNAIKEGRLIEDGADQYVFVPYDQLILIFKPSTDFNDVKVGDVYPLNGFLLIKPLEYATEANSAGISAAGCQVCKARESLVREHTCCRLLCERLYRFSCGWPGRIIVWQTRRKDLL